MPATTGLSLTDIAATITGTPRDRGGRSSSLRRPVHRGAHPDGGLGGHPGRVRRDRACESRMRALYRNAKWNDRSKKFLALAAALAEARAPDDRREAADAAPSPLRGEVYECDDYQPLALGPGLRGPDDSRRGFCRVTPPPTPEGAVGRGASLGAAPARR